MDKKRPEHRTIPSTDKLNTESTFGIEDYLKYKGVTEVGEGKDIHDVARDILGQRVVAWAERKLDPKRESPKHREGLSFSQKIARLVLVVTRDSSGPEGR
ncbi:hypothetical protein EOL71_03700 [Candidatus Saccharibacteria bacterium]|nr:hypothetical protein [Candidatus Saccharibacteria bacterium]